MPTQPKKKLDSQPMTATKRLLAGLRDGKMADIELVGDDGVRVPALRCVLACASPVLHKLLYGDPTRATQSVIKISGCGNKTLRALVEYCCSDELNASIWDGSCPPSEIVKDIVALARVSHAYGIPNMEERVLDGINPLMGAIPPLACVVFNYADPNTTNLIYSSALALIREKPYTCLQQEGQNIGGMVCLSPDKLKAIIRDVALEVDELFLFNQLVRWRSHNRNVYSNASAICKALVAHIDLTYIDPRDIKAVVLDSGLVEDKTVIDALLDQSISATREGLAFAAMRGSKAKNQVYAMVQGTGNADINGLYKQVPRAGTLLCFGKIIDEKRMMLLLKDTHTSWKICDNSHVYYQWRSSDENHFDQFPVTGWMDVTHGVVKTKSVPTVKWFRPRGSTPRLPTSMSRLSSSSSMPFDHRQSPGDIGLDSLSHTQLRQHQSMDETERRQSPSHVRSPGSHASHHSYRSDSSPHMHPQMRYASSNHHSDQHLRPSRSMKEDYLHHQRAMSGVSALESPVPVRAMSPRLNFTSLPPVKESASWAM